MWREAWRYRGFIGAAIRNEFRLKYARSRLGLLWAILHPLVQVALFAFILSSVLSARLPGNSGRFAYAVYLMAGMLGWSLFSEIVGRFVNLFVESGHLLRKVRFPRITLPLASAGAALLNNALLATATILVCGLLGHGPHAALIWLLPLTLVTLVFAGALGLLLGTFNVFARDWGQVAPVLLQIWFWCTPIVYPLSILDPAFRGWLDLNPLLPVIEGYQDVILRGAAPDFLAIVPTAIVAALLAALALFLFRRAADDIVEAL
jgi:lipopolysaccharide transport system permease protein